jgi:hypothetical protein
MTAHADPWPQATTITTDTLLDDSAEHAAGLVHAARGGTR